jgi:hypothetical protein
VCNARVEGMPPTRHTSNVRSQPPTIRTIPLGGGVQRWGALAHTTPSASATHQADQRDDDAD